MASLPLSAVRGQITHWRGNAGLMANGEATRPAFAAPHLPVAGAGYVLALSRDHWLCGATTQHHDHDPAVREADHRHNLQQAARLGACEPIPEDVPLPAGLEGRTAWRATTPDRLPLIGALPWSPARIAGEHGRRRDQIRFVPRERTIHGGLFVMTGLGSRGITWASLAGDLLAHWVTGAPCPLEADLRDALDPARFLVRETTKGGSTPSAVTTRTDRQ